MLGIDVSNHQGSIDWAALRAADIRFAFVKASEGLTFRDAFFEENRAKAIAAGVPVGPYHFARPELNPAVAEARYFSSIVGALRKNELRPVLDLETGPVTPTWARDFLNETERLLGVRPMLYSYPDFLAGLSSQPNYPVLKQWPLWLASYGPNDGQPHAAPDVGFRMACHQYTSVGTAAGLAGVDLNRALQLNDLREMSDYLLWRDWKLTDGETATRPLGVPTTIPLRWQDAYAVDALAITNYAARQTDPLVGEVVALQNQLALAEAKIDNARAALA